jgi:hypothetical protein
MEIQELGLYELAVKFKLRGNKDERNANVIMCSYVSLTLRQQVIAHTNVFTYQVLIDSV